MAARRSGSPLSLGSGAPPSSPAFSRPVSLASSFRKPGGAAQPHDAEPRLAAAASAGSFKAGARARGGGGTAASAGRLLTPQQFYALASASGGL